MKLFLLLFLLVPYTAWSQGHGLGAHEHGAIKLGIAVEGKTIELSIDGPSESFIGFEYRPKTAQEKAVFDKAKNLWTKDFFKLVNFDKNLGCSIVSSTFEQVGGTTEFKKGESKKEEGVHSDIEATIKIACAKDVTETKAIVSLKKHFKNIKKLTAEVLGKETKNYDIIKDSQEIKL
jgi:hypothetical protein